MLHRLTELDELVRSGYDTFDFKRIARALIDFMNVELASILIFARTRFTAMRRRAFAARPRCRPCAKSSTA